MLVSGRPACARRASPRGTAGTDVCGSVGHHHAPARCAVAGSRTAFDRRPAYAAWHGSCRLRVAWRDAGRSSVLARPTRTPAVAINSSVQSPRHGCTPRTGRQKFFAGISFSVATTSIYSANSFFSLAFLPRALSAWAPPTPPSRRISIATCRTSRR